MSGGGARWRGVADDVRGKHARNRGIELVASRGGSEVITVEGRWEGAKLGQRG